MRYWKKLILFDIDGTLMYHIGKGKVGLKRFAHALEHAYGIADDFDPTQYNGMIDRQMAWKIVSRHGISRETFLSKFPAYIAGMLEHLKEAAKNETLYTPISDAVELVKLLHKQKGVALGLITGNARRVAEWKLDHAQIARTYFVIGLYGEEADDRSQLARLVFEKSTHELHQSFSPNAVVVVGDTVHDIQCGKAIGAATIAVTTGLHGSREPLAAEKPDLLVDSLMEKAVRDFLGV